MIENKPFQIGDKIVRITTPPIHTHYSSDTGKDEVCGRVFCPNGFVGIEVIGNKPDLTNRPNRQ